MKLFIPLLLAIGISLTPIVQETNAADAPGIKVGEQAPDFSLVDQQGKKRSLKELRKDKKVAIVFHRSARW